MTEKQVLVLQHIDPEDLGTIAQALDAEKLTYRYIRTDRGEALPESLEGVAGLVVMGGPMGVYEQYKYPFLAAEAQFIREVVDAKKPVLGVCLGSQLLAHALGASVYPGKRKEIGWYPVMREPGAKDDLLAGQAPDQFVGMHWHGDVFDLPKGAVPLASSELTRYQAFRYGKNAYGMLFHMEVTLEQVGTWCDVFADEVRQVGTTKAAILEQAPEYLPRLQKVGQAVFGTWAKLAAAD